MRRLLAAAAAAWLACGPAQAALPGGEVETALESARGAWRQGRPEDAVSGWKYVLTIAPDNLEADVNLALTLRDLGRPRDALPLWLKAELLAPDDAGLRTEFGWTRLAAGDIPEARSAFQEAVKLSTGAFDKSEALLGLALTALTDGDAKKSLAPLREAYVLHPYWLAGESHLMALAAGKYRREAIVHERQAVSDDPLNYDSVAELARLYDKVGDPALAYQSYEALLRLSPGDADLKRRAAKQAKYLDADPDALLGITRLGWPLQKKPESRGGPAVSVALFADDGGAPAELRSLRFISAQDFKVDDERLGTVVTGKAGAQWELRLDPARALFELYDNQGALRHATRQSLTISPLVEGGSILLKSARPAGDWRGVDPGDRELLGAMVLRRAGKGFVAVNETTLETILPSAVALTLPSSQLAEAYKAAAVVARTEAENDLETRHPGAPYKLCDSRHCLLYRGLATESKTAQDAVRATAGQTLALEGRRIAAHAHAACGGRTEADAAPAVSDAPGAPVEMLTPWQLERAVRSEPPPELFDLGSRYEPPSAVRWFRVIDMREARSRERALGLDPPTAVTPLARSASGRLLGLRWTTRSGSKDLTLAQAEAALSPGTLRSGLFTVRPLYDGRELRWLVLFGIGTGDGRGLCRAGAQGLAAQGRSYLEILSHYFPGVSILGGGEAGTKAARRP